MSNATLIDTTNCIGCRSCQVACKQWNEHDGEKTELNRAARLPEPRRRSRAKTLHAHHLPRGRRPEPAGRAAVRLREAAVPALLEPACVSACPMTALHKTKDGPVVYDDVEVHRLPLLHVGLPVGRADRGVGLARAEDPQVHALCRPARCSRRRSRATARRSPTTSASGSPRRIALPACVKACPADALRFGKREEMLARGAQAHRGRARTSTSTTSTARRRPAGRACCTSSRVPFEKLGFPTSGRELPGAQRRRRSGPCPPAVIGVGAAARRRRTRCTSGVRRSRRWSRPQVGQGRRAEDAHHHVEFEPVEGEAADPFERASSGAHGVRRRSRSSRASRSGSAAPRTSPTPTRGGSGSSSTSCGSRWRRARSRRRASSTSSSARISTRSDAPPC